MRRVFASSAVASRRMPRVPARAATRALAFVCVLLTRIARARASDRDWRRFRSPPFDGRPCTVPRASVDELSLETFARTFESAETPVVVTGLGARRTGFVERVERGALLRELGAATVTLSSANAHSRGKLRKSLRGYVEEDVAAKRRTDGKEDASEIWYWFGDHVESDGTMSNGFETLFGAYDDLEYVGDANVAYSFGVGGQFSGVPMHTHGPGWSESLIGRKHWFLAPPDATPNFDPNVTAYAWALEALRRGDVRDGEGGILECTVNAGEAIYFPPNWWHATVNLDESVFISSFVNSVQRARDEL